MGKAVSVAEDIQLIFEIASCLNKPKLRDEQSFAEYYMAALRGEAPSSIFVCGLLWID